MADRIRQEREHMTAITELYYRHAAAIFNRYPEWKDKDEYYFIELNLDMAYVSPEFIARIADPPYYLGTIVRADFEYPDFFARLCSERHLALAYAYSGSPLSERVSQKMVCLYCGKKETLELTGWHERSQALKTIQAEDLERRKNLGKDFRPADLRDLLRLCEVPEEELALPEIEQKIKRIDDGRFICERDPYGGVRLEDTRTGRTTFYRWLGLKE